MRYLIRRQKIKLVLRPTQTYLNLMKPPGMSKALEALRCARVASKGMRESKGPHDFLVAWSSFLSEFQTTYNMMYAVIDEKEAKEAHWKKKVKIDRETDPVLNWLTAARHVASHVAAFQIQKITGPSKLSISLIPENSQNLADARELFAVIAPTMITPNSLPPWIKGSKVMVDPPEYHFGKSLKSDLKCNQLWDITDLALNYLERMITEAKKYFTIMPQHKAPTA